MVKTKPTSKTQKVRSMLAKGYTVHQIAKAVGVKPQMVYSVRWRMNKQGGLASIPTAKAGDVVANVSGVEVIVPPSQRVVDEQQNASFLTRLWETFKRFW